MCLSGLSAALTDALKLTLTLLTWSDSYYLSLKMLLLNRFLSINLVWSCSLKTFRALMKWSGRQRAFFEGLIWVLMRKSWYECALIFWFSSLSHLSSFKEISWINSSCFVYWTPRFLTNSSFSLAFLAESTLVESLWANRVVLPFCMGSLILPMSTLATVTLRLWFLAIGSPDSSYLADGWFEDPSSPLNSDIEDCPEVSSLSCIV